MNKLLSMTGKLKTGYFVITVIVSILISFFVFFYETVHCKIFICENLQCKNSFGKDPEPIVFFTQHPKWLIWLFMANIQIVFCINIIPFLINMVTELVNKFRFSWQDKTFHIILLIAFLIATLVPNIIDGWPQISDYIKTHEIMANFNNKILVLIAIGYATVLLCVFALLVINTSIINSEEMSLLEFLYYKNKLNMLLNILGFILTASTIATGILNNALHQPSIFPREMVYSYGLFNTFFVSLVFLPVYFNLNNFGKKLIETKMLDNIDNIDPEIILKKKNAYEELYELKEDYLTLLKKATPILGPLLTSLITFSGIQ